MPARQASKISEHECRAMRELANGEYSISELAFIFETQSKTVRRHIEKECPHNPLHNAKLDHGWKEYSDDDLLTAFRIVQEKQPYKSMSQGVYDEFRPDEFPASSTIMNRIGGWPEAREQALE